MRLDMQFKIVHGDNDAGDRVNGILYVEAPSWYDAREYAKRFLGADVYPATDAEQVVDAIHVNRHAMSSHERHLDEHDATYKRGYQHGLRDGRAESIPYREVVGYRVRIRKYDFGGCAGNLYQGPEKLVDAYYLSGPNVVTSVWTKERIKAFLFKSVQRAELARSNLEQLYSEAVTRQYGCDRIEYKVIPVVRRHK